MVEALQDVLRTAWAFIAAQNPFTSILDILLVAFTIYNLIKLIRDSRAEQLLKGIFILLVAYAAASLLQLRTLHYLLQMIFDNALLLLVVIFQPEIRRALEQAGHSRGFRSLVNRRQTAEQEWRDAIQSLVSAAELLRDWHMGALFVLERNTKLGEIAQTGTTIDAAPTSELMVSIFYDKAPLHDGAMILREGRIHAVGCFLPMSDAPLSRELGTRHRAAVGMSENSDALVVVVSEETGVFSIASAGELVRDLTPQALQTALEEGLFTEQKKKKWRWRKS